MNEGVLEVEVDMTSSSQIKNMNENLDLSIGSLSNLK